MTGAWVVEVTPDNDIASTEARYRPDRRAKGWVVRGDGGMNVNINHDDIGDLGSKNLKRGTSHLV